MEDTHLSRKVDYVKRDFESVIDDLIAKIEELESDNDEMQNKIYILKKRIAELESEEVGND